MSNPLPHNTTITLRQAAAEIRQLRRQLEVAQAKVEVVQVFQAALLGRPHDGVGFSPDVVFELDRIVERADRAEAEVKDRIVTAGPATAGLAGEKLPGEGSLSLPRVRL